MGGRKKSSSSSSKPAQVVKAGEVTGGESYGGSLSDVKKKKGTLADEQSVGVLANALVEKLGQ
jgi:hypothetical protein